MTRGPGHVQQKNAQIAAFVLRPGRLILAAALLALCLPAKSDPAIHYAPAENLEHIDVALIDIAWVALRRAQGRSAAHIAR